MRQTREKIPFNRPCFVGSELKYIQEAVEGGQISGDGRYGRKCESLLEELLGADCVLLTTSCTHALEIAALLTGVGPGDEFIVPSFTFVSTVNAFAIRGARPVFVDIRADTLNLNEAGIEEVITERTRVIVPVHYAGVGCEMDRILEVARKHGITVVEDNAHGLFGRYRGASLGTLGALGTLSFHETKNFICGEGGALIVNEPSWRERAEICRAKGTNRKQFMRGEVDRYSWVDLGSSYVLSELLGAFLLAQIEAREYILALRRRVFDRYMERLADWAASQGVRLPIIPSHCEQPYHMFHLIMPSERSRDALIRWLRERGITSVFHYVPLHLSPMGRKCGGAERDLPVTEDLSCRILRLPFFTDLSEEDQDRVCAAILQFECSAPPAGDPTEIRRSPTDLSYGKVVAYFQSGP